MTARFPFFKKYVPAGVRLRITFLQTEIIAEARAPGEHFGLAEAPCSSRESCGIQWHALMTKYYTLADSNGSKQPGRLV